jgi:hypothetical protein
MKRFYSTREICKKLKLNRSTINKWFKDRQCPKPQLSLFGDYKLRLWSSVDLRRLRVYAGRRYGRRSWDGPGFRGGRAKVK